ncbi:6-phosphofructokinase 1 [Hydrogenispora ethanolica]|uniref:Pyrophosphate--fructose 6-phosphate 1-phosphotransferase n=1 Tax=Hydrogenispora ethanolica TaxID=1082276 RepID=A0A4R1R895_HYDET|nr:diphosphate--fructose-6-phosphate 1-phosphotransferase [Hydrogenispora ethanolica]TCL61874.1 6-phosphofructokinase 1 [Hydrogenispora ethanolica]
MKDQILVVHGGGPTAVINASLYGVIQEAARHPEVAVYGAVGGVDGIFREAWIDLLQQPEEQLQRLPWTPASALGTSRTKLLAEDYQQIVSILKRNNIRYLLFNGGNGSMDTCGKIQELASAHGIQVLGIPKTIDNDIAVTDHCPGYGSAARYLATSVAEAAQDVQALPIHVSIIEAMGRNAGWIAAASALARRRAGMAPHLIYLPERPFHPEEFLEDVDRLHKELGGVVVVASEGLVNADGRPIVEPLLTKGRDVYFGDVGTHLAVLVMKELGIKARSEKPGILGRASIALQSAVDREEAIRVGEFAVQSLLEGKTGYMVGYRRVSDEPYSCETVLIPLAEVMLNERKMPDRYINARGNDVTDEFLSYCRPLIGEALPRFSELR